MTQVLSINGAFDENLLTNIKARMTKVSKIKPNLFKKIIPYNQKKNPYCTAYASAGVYTYNHGKKFTDQGIFDWADPILKGSGARSSFITQKFAEWQGAKQMAILVGSSTAEVILEAGYALALSTVCPPEFWTDGIDDGKIDKKYSRKADGGHLIVLIKEKGVYRLVNSWGDYEKKGKFNTYKIDLQEMIKSKLVRPECFFIF